MLLDDNLQKIGELRQEVQWAGVAWCVECDRLNLQFRILEAYRTQQRQNALYAQGRTKPGAIVTFTKNSLHTQRLAVDIKPLNCSHKQIADVAARYGITHPYGFDPPHYEFRNVPPVSSIQIVPAPVRLRQLKGRLEREQDPKIKTMIEREIKRLQRRIKSKENA